MQSFLCLEAFTSSLWVVNPDTCTKVWISSIEQYTAQLKFREIVRFVGGTADTTLHRTDDLVDGKPIWGELWALCRDVDEFNDVGTGGTTPAPQPVSYKVTLSGEAVPS